MYSVFCMPKSWQICRRALFKMLLQKIAFSNLFQIIHYSFILDSFPLLSLSLSLYFPLFLFISLSPLVIPIVGSTESCKTWARAPGHRKYEAICTHLYCNDKIKCTEWFPINSIYWVHQAFHIPLCILHLATLADSFSNFQIGLSVNKNGRVVIVFSFDLYERKTRKWLGNTSCEH